MQRKRHINFKLHSIPILNKIKYMKKHNVLYSIPCDKSCARLWGITLVLAVAYNLILCVHAANAITLVPQGVLSDSTTISAITGAGSIIPPTASLSLSNSNMTSSASVPGSVVTVDTGVTVSIAHANSYSLILKVNNTNMKNGNTTITAGNAIDNNTWGYKWDGASTYAAPSISGTNLAVPTLANNATTFTKNLTFGAKFASDADAGTYHASGILSLIVSPETALSHTLADLTQMQQLTLAPDACANTPYLNGQNYSAEYTLTDVRDNNTYTVRRLGDGKCWMTQNLKLSTQNGKYIYGRRQLIPNTTDISSSWYLPETNSGGFSSNTISNAYVSNDTGYYSWCAATAGTAGGCINPYDNSADSPTSAITSGNAASSICPKGWKLPTGDQPDKNNNNFWKLLRNMGLTISNDDLSYGSGGLNYWDANDLAKTQGIPYNFTYTGYIFSSNTSQLGNDGYWWSSTASSGVHAYALYTNDTYVSPGTYAVARSNGYAVRCVAE